MSEFKKDINTIINKQETGRLDRIIDFAKSLDEKEQDAFVNVIIGFNIAKSLNLTSNSAKCSNY